MIQKNIDSLKNALLEAQTIIEHIRGSINSGKCNTCYACDYIMKLNESIVNVLQFSKSLFPTESDYLMTYVNRLSGVSKINAYDFGGVLAIINIISAKVNTTKSRTNGVLKVSDIVPVKIFISHSSKDKPVVESFITSILRLGCGLQPNDILCSSIESTGIKTGKDIRDYLQKQLLSCDYVFFMISENYLNSSICLNEMGGAWVLDKEVKPFLFPQSEFADMGWLYEISKGAKLNNDEALDELRDELLSKYKLIEHPQTSDWTAQKKKFFASLPFDNPKSDNTNNVATSATLNQSELSESECTLYEIIKNNPQITYSDISNILDWPHNYIVKIMSNLVRKNKITHVKGPRNATWKIIE